MLRIDSVRDLSELNHGWKIGRELISKQKRLQTEIGSRDGVEVTEFFTARHQAGEAPAVRCRIVWLLVQKIV
jgi:hypothetical protein